MACRTGPDRRPKWSKTPNRDRTDYPSVRWILIAYCRYIKITKKELKDSQSVCGFLCDGYGTRFSKSEGGGRGRGVKEKRHGVKEKRNGVKEKLRTPSYPTMVIVCVNEATNSTGDPAKGRNSWNRSLDSDRPINAKAEVKILKASILNIHLVLAYGLSVMTTKLGNPIMLNSYTSSMCLLSWGRMDYARALIDIRAHQELKEDMIVAIPNMKDDNEILHTVKPKKPIWQVVYKKNSASLSGMKKNSELFRKVMHSTNPFDALNMIEEGDESGSYWGSPNSGKKVVQDVVGSISHSPSNTSLVARINDLKSQMIEEKHVLLDDEGKR
uniref:Reverse transcriptase domain-containing protein n=1 Tax=Tanacetum cinerariifolium TaxID=118510 RepID=A0A6L2MIZ8_TANCI|nr:reverse transcriptase domain-containing protein [Tanacetum cinerariifolium]